tara:strand:- start:1127 stop:1759 length:633 start_codon:yes stop_codon:yes gene_type:complete
MFGGYVSCIRNNWKSENFGEKYNELEAEGLNILNICKHGNGTDNYNISLNSTNNWYLKDKPRDKKSLGEILNDLRDKNIKKLDYKINNKSDNLFNKALNKFHGALKGREEKNAKYENTEGTNLTNKTIGHMNYISNLQSFMDRLHADSNYIEERRKIMKLNKTRKNRSRSKSKNRSRSKNRTRSKNRSRSRSSRNIKSRGKSRRKKLKKN